MIRLVELKWPTGRSSNRLNLGEQILILVNRNILNCPIKNPGLQIFLLTLK